MTLTSLEPVVTLELRIVLLHGGWTVVERHRHYSGVVGDCPPQTYERLTLAEANDVALACMDVLTLLPE